MTTPTPSRTLEAASPGIAGLVVALGRALVRRTLGRVVRRG